LLYAHHNNNNNNNIQAKNKTSFACTKVHVSLSTKKTEKKNACFVFVSTSL